MGCDHAICRLVSLRNKRVPQYVLPVRAKNVKDFTFGQKKSLKINYRLKFITSEIVETVIN